MIQNNQNTIRDYDPYEYQKNEFGKVGFPFDVIKSRKADYANVFSEGSPALKNLLLHLWENNIETKACCTGHAGVQSFTKNTLFGQKTVNLEEWLMHKDSPRYHRWTKDTPAYFVFKTKPGEDAKEIGRQIREGLAHDCPQLPFFVSPDSDSIAIHLKHYVLPNHVEQFFAAITSSISRVMGLQISVSRKDVDVLAPQKPSLSSIIAGADARQAAQVPLYSKAKSIQYAPEGR